ncbi:hypothetical protein ALC62_12895 [Cyphomyrmex costatus]|uniref:YqaJ viral recombinase domain-containing protein n=1 Tax=Cyphomyrmex costatus TaxID=456900 RepID=A0A151IAG9_9HYME|nr:hypothetical protein ALC62_12895 [Cyphomyrmex costatus]
MNKIVPPVVEKLEKERQKKVATTRESRQRDGKKRKIKEAGTSCDYGPQAQKPDLEDHIFQQQRQEHLDKFLEEAKTWKDLERLTIDRRESGRWFSLRDKRLTASNFGPICRMRPTTSCAATVKNILYPPLVDTAAMKYGRDREEVAKNQLAVKLNKKIESCGFFIDSENPCLGYTPDGLIDDDGVVEIKCPQSAEHLTIEEALKTLLPLKAIFNKKDP